MELNGASQIKFNSSTKPYYQMIMKELLQQMADGNFKVEINHDIPNATSRIGLIQEVKVYGSNIGVAVLFTGMKWEIWFYDNEDVETKRFFLKNLSTYKPLVAEERRT